LIADFAGVPKIDRVLIVRLSAMGDVIHTLPAVQALRLALPHATIGWLIEERWAELLCTPSFQRRGPRSSERPVVDAVHTVNLAGWRTSLFALTTFEQIAKVWNDVRSAQYQVAIDLQGAIRSAVLSRWSGAPVIYGVSEPRESPSSLFYTRQVIAGGTHVIEQNLSLARALTGRFASAPRAKFPRDSAAEQHICRLLSGQGISDFAILNPGAGWGAKRWPADRYGAVARELAGHGLRSLVNYGPGEENLAQDVVSASAGTAEPMKCSITELIAVTRRARLFVGGDTGPLHLAAALGIPVVAIFGPTDPARNGPYGTRSVVLRNPASLTSHARRPQPDEGMLEITVGAVIDSAQRAITGRAERTDG